jgi:hypothetical protein
MSLLRYRLAEVLVPLAASPDEQSAYFERTGEDIDELALDFEWTRQWTPALADAGVIDAGIASELDALEVALQSSNSDRVRQHSRAVLDRFRTEGRPTPSITEELRAPRDHAPQGW